MVDESNKVSANGYGLKDLIEPEMLFDIQEGFAHATGVACGLMGAEGQWLCPPSNHTEFCTMVRSVACGRENCRLCDFEHARLAEHAPEVECHECWCGLLDWAAPIRLGGKAVGYVLCGQVLPEGDLTREQMDQFHRAGLDLGIPPDRLIEAVQWVPRIPPQRLNELGKGLQRTASHIANLAHQALVVRVIGEYAIKMSGNLGREALCDAILDIAEQLIGYDQASVNLLHEASGTVRAMRCRGTSREVEAADFPLGEGHIGSVVKESEPILANDLDGTMRVQPLRRDVGSNKEMHSALTVPFTISGKTVGAIQVCSRHRGTFTPVDQETLCTIAAHAGFAIAASTLYEVGQRHRRAVRNMDTLLTEIYRITDLGKLLNLTLDRLKVIIPYDDAAVWLWDTKRNRLSAEAVVSHQPEDIWRMEFYEGEGYPGSLIRERYGLLEHNRSDERTRREKYATELNAHHIHSLVGTPIWFRERFLGVLMLASQKQYGYDEPEKALLQDLSQHLGLALGMAESRKRLRHGLLLQLVAQQLFGANDEKDILQRVVQTTSTLLKSGGCTIWLPNESRELVLAAAVGPYAKVLEEGGELTVNLDSEGLIPHVAREKQTVREKQSKNNLAWSSDLDDRIRLDREPGAEAVIAAPLELPCKGTGVICVTDPLETETRSRKKIYHYADELTLGAIARFLTDVLTKIEYCQNSVDPVVLQNLLQGEASRLTTNALLQAALSQILGASAEMLGVSRASVWLFDDTRKRVVLRAAYGPRTAFIGVHTFDVGQGFTGWVAETGEEFIRNEPYENDARFLPQCHPQSVYGTEPVGLPLMILPLHGARGLLGVLKFSERREEDGTVISLTDEEVRLAETVADQFTKLIESAESETVRASQLQALSEVSRVLGIHAHLDALLPELDKQISRFIQADVFYVALYRKEIQLLRFEYIRDGEILYPKRDCVSTESFFRKVMEESEPFLIRDRLERRPDMERIGDESKDSASVIRVSMMAGDEIVGALSVQSYTDHAYNQGDVSLLQMIANGIAPTVRNLIQREALRRWMSDAPIRHNLNQIIVEGGGLGFVTKRVLQEVADQTLNLVGAKRASIRILDSERATLEFAAWSGPDWTDQRTSRLYPLSGKSAAANAAENKEPVVLHDVHNARCYVQLFSDIASHISVPMMRGPEVIGVLSADYDRKDALDESDVDILIFLANQISSALAKAELLDRSYLLEVERALPKASENGFESVANDVMERIANLMSVQGCSLWIVEPKIGKLRPLGSTGLARWPGDEEGYELGQGLTGWVWEQNRELLVNDESDIKKVVPKPSWRKIFPEELGGFPPEEARVLLVPVKVGECVAGALRVSNSRQKREFTDHDVNTLRVLADRLGAKLKAEQDASRIIALAKANSRIIEATTELAMCEAAFEAMCDILRCPFGHVRILQDDKETLKKITGREAVPELSEEDRKVGDYLSGIVAGNLKAVVIDDTHHHDLTEFMRDFNHPNHNLHHKDFLEIVRSQVCFPMIATDKLVGTLSAHALVPSAFSEVDLAIVGQLATNLAMGLTNLRLWGNAARQEVLADLGILSSGVAHNVKTSLADIAHAAERLRSEAPPEDTLTLLHRIEKDVRHASQVMNNLLLLAQPPKGVAKALSIEGVIADVVLLAEYELANKHIQIEIQLMPDLPTVYADSTDLSQAMCNVIDNSRQAMSKGGLLTIRACTDEKEENVQIDFQDTGPGIPSHLLPERVFEPFVTCREGAPGSGLGLFTARQTLRRWGGDMTAINVQQGQGAIIRLRIPISKGGRTNATR